MKRIRIRNTGKYSRFPSFFYFFSIINLHIQPEEYTPLHLSGWIVSKVVLLTCDIVSRKTSPNSPDWAGVQQAVKATLSAVHICIHQVSSGVHIFPNSCHGLTGGKSGFFKRLVNRGKRGRKLRKINSPQ